MRIKGTYRIEF